MQFDNQNGEVLQMKREEVGRVRPKFQWRAPTQSDSTPKLTINTKTGREPLLGLAIPDSSNPAESKNQVIS